MREARQRQGVFRRQPCRACEIRHKPQRAPAGHLRDCRHAVCEQARVAAHLIDDKALDQRRVGWRQHVLGAHKACDHPAPVDIAHQHHRQPRRLREAHIRDVVRAQIDLGRAARTLHENQIVRRAQPPEASARRHQRALPAWNSRARAEPITLPCTTICAPTSLCGLSSTGFRSTVIAQRAARAWSACARPISPPSSVTAALFDMFCGLNGATR